MLSMITYNVPHLVYWDWRIATDLFCGGIGVGAFLLAVLNSLVYKDKYPAVSRVGAVLSPIMVILGLVLMVADLGHPLRLWRTVTGFNVSSPLSWGGPFQTLLIVIGIVYAYLWLRPSTTKLRNTVGIIGLPVALIVGAYHGWLLTILRARPLWNTGSATVSALLGFVTTGMAAVLLILCLSPRARGKDDETLGKKRFSPWMIHDFRYLLVAAMILQGLTFFVWWISLLYGPTDARAALSAANAAWGPLFWVGAIGLGLVVPILLQIVEIARHRPELDRINIPLTVITTVLILAGGYVFRYAVVMAGQI